MIPWLYTVTAIIGVILAYSLRARLSRANISAATVLICLCFNLCFFALNYKIIIERCFVLYGCLPDLQQQHPAIRWICAACLLLHCFASPVGWEPKRWFSTK